MDTCKEKAGEVLTQDERAVAYESRKIKEHKHNYSSYDLELPVVVHALKLL